MYRITLFILISFSAGHIMAQQGLSKPTTLSIANTGTGKFYYANQNEAPRAIEFKERTVTISNFLININNYFNIPSEFTFIEAESNTDNLGMRHRLLQQYYKGILLEGMGYRVHEKDGFITSANGKAVRNIDLNTQVILNEEQAFHLAVKYLNTKDTVVRPGKKLIVSKGFIFTSESFSIAFQFDLDVSLIERWRISIDAHNGQLINKVSLVNSCFKEKEIAQPLPYGTGTGLTNYYGNKTIQVEKYENGSSRLVGQTKNGGTIGTYDFRNVSIIPLILGFPYKVYDFYSSNNTYNNSYQKPAVSVQWAAEQAYEYYFKKYNRNSFDNKGGVITSYVHVDVDLDNAFWTGELLVFGDGSNNNPLVELDVVGHELTHGVTQHEAHLQYSYESGALNESFSDIFGKAIEFDTFGDTATWQLGRHFRNGGIRDMSNPNLKNQPDTYSGDMWYTGYDDSGGVHTNSGVQNFWFYLLCEGGSGVNDSQVNYSVKSIGMDTAANITYRNLTEYLSYFSDYLDSRIGSLLATADLYGKNSTAYQEVDKAWDAVGVIDEPIITSLEVYDITATTVKIKGSLLPRGDTVTYHFEYGTTPAYGNSSSIYKYIDKVECIITGLQSKTKYYLRLVATNENGSSYATTEFATISLAPLVKIKQTVDVTETTATLYGQINPNSLPTSFYFEYGPTPAFGLMTSSYPVPDTTEFLNVSAPVIDLQTRQTYYYRLVATNGFASTLTGSVSFFTAVKPVISSYTPVSAPIDIEITITGQNFNSKPEKNLVSFGATLGTVLSSSSTEIKVKVPVGASLGTITLLDAESGLAAESVQEFVPTFTGEFKKGSLQLRAGFNDAYFYQTLVQDMDGDNKPDIIASSYQGFSVFQNVNQGGDITNESFIRNSYTGEFYQGYIIVVDLDGNGLKDIAIPYQNGLRIYPNFSVPGFIFLGVPVDVTLKSFGQFTFDDFDQDGRVDIAAIGYMNSDSSMISIFRNQNPKGSLSADNFVQKYQEILPYYAYFLQSDDLNNDGKPDLTASVFESFVPMLKNISKPDAFEFEQSIVQDSTKSRYTRNFSQDLNQDGWKDIALPSIDQIGNLSILENSATSANITMAKPIIGLSGYVESAVQPGDIDGDGKVDLLVGINKGKFILLKNKTATGAHLSESSFDKFEEYGVINPDSYQQDITINDLNGDGRPEVINTYSYNRFPHDGYQLEIWQNSPNACLDPSLINITNISNNAATIVLPPNTTLDQFEIEYAPSGNTYWWPAYSTTLSNLAAGYSYKLRARAKCYLGFTDYYYIDFTTDCYTTSYFSISSIGIDNVIFNSPNYNLEVQYALADKDEWSTLPLYSNKIWNLMPGTTYDLRMRAICNTPVEFEYSKFTTGCPMLTTTLTITDLIYNKAVVHYTGNYAKNAILEYSSNNVDWILIDYTGQMFPLTPGKKYFVRGSVACTDINSDFINTSFTTPCPKVSMLHIDTITPFGANINWVDESNTDNYILTYSRTASGTLTTMQTNSTSFNLDNLNPGTQYKVAVAPQCVVDNSFTSTTFNTVCYVPFNLAANDITHTTAELSWSDNFSGVPYSIDYSISGSNAWLTTEAALTKISLSELRPGAEYEAQVHINCISVKAPYVSLFFKTDLYSETTFAPNPTDNEITIYPSKNLIGNRFSIHDNVGKKVAEAKLLDYTIDLSILSNGIYTLKIDGETPIKIIKH